MKTFLFNIYRDEPSYHNAGDYSVPYGGVPAHHNTWQHPDVQQMQNAQQDARQQQRYDMDSLFRESSFNMTRGGDEDIETRSLKF